MPLLDLTRAQRPAAASAQRLLFLDALRAFGSLAIMLHHFALYPPLRDLAAPLLGAALDWLEHNARTTQIFFVASGFVLARSLSRQHWDLRRCGLFVLQRYCRLGLPYFGAIALVLLAYAAGRDVLPEQITGSPLTVEQLLTHFVFLQDLLGHQQLSAGFWFVCINFQLGLLYALLLVTRDTLGAAGAARRVDAEAIVGWALAAYSLFVFNRDSSNDAWALYFFPYFYMGIVVQRALRRPSEGTEFWLYQALFAAAMLYDWRWRLVIAMLVGLAVYAAERTGLSRRWPKSRAVAWLGKVSYSLFLVHVPVLVFVAALFVGNGWTSPAAAVAGLLCAVALSIAGAGLFNQLVERPAGWLAHRLPIAPKTRPGDLAPAAETGRSG